MFNPKTLTASAALFALVAMPALALELSADAKLGASPEDMTTVTVMSDSAFVGNEVERANGDERYRIIVRLDGGGTIAVHEVGEGQLRIGDRVRVIGNRVYRG